MHIIQQFISLLVEPRVLATFVARCKDIFCNRVLFLVVHNGFAIKSIVPNVGLINYIVRQLEV